MTKLLFIILGSVSLAFGVVGIVIPGLPTTPFLLLSAGLYLRSSRKLYEFLINHRILGPYITHYSGGLNKKAKIKIMLIMWPMIFATILFMIENIYVKFTIVFAGILGTIVVVLLPSVKTE